MADLLPSSPDSSVGEDGDPRVIGVDSEDADDLLAALQSDTARDLLAALYDDPATPSALADEVDTSIQNVRYHLEKLTDADLVEVADTVYSEKGREMKVYAPVAKPLVVFAGGSDDDAPGLEAALSSLLGGLGVLGLSSLVVQRLFGRGSLVPNVTFASGGGSEAAPPSAETPTPDAAGAGNQSGEYAGRATGEAATAAEESTATVLTDASDATAEAADATTAESATAVTRTVADAAGTTVETTQTGVNAASTETAAETTRTVTEAAETTRTVTEATRTEALTETTTDVFRATTEQAVPTAEEVATVTEGARTVAEGAATTTLVETGGATTAGLPPGLAFFAGGLVVLATLGLAWYVRKA